MSKENLRKCLEAHLGKKAGKDFGGEFDKERGVMFECENYSDNCDGNNLPSCQLTNYSDSSGVTFFSDDEAKDICKFRDMRFNSRCGCKGIIRVLDEPYEKYSVLLDRLKERWKNS